MSTRRPDLSDEQNALLARLLRGSKAGLDRPTGPALEPRPAGSAPVLSFAQQRLWFLDRLQPGAVAYVMPEATYRITGPLDPAALETALRLVFDRHPVLRSRFPEAEGGPRVEHVDGIPLRRVDLTGAPDPVAAAAEFTRAEGGTPFELATGPLVRTTLLRLGAEDHVLQTTAHHSVFDGWSMDVYGRDLGLAYRAVLGGTEPDWPDLPVSYADFAAWQREVLSGAATEAASRHWREVLAGAPPVLELLADRPRPPVPSQRGGTIGFTVPAATAEALRALSREHGASLFMTTLAAYQVLLGRYGQTSDVVVGIPTAGRTRPELEDLIGFFVNSLPLRADVRRERRFTELLASTREAVLDAFAHQDLPFDKLVEDLAPERDLSRNPLVQTWFDLFTPRTTLHVDGAVTERFAPPWTTTRFDLELHLHDQPDGTLAGQLVYAVDLFERATAERFARHYRTLLEAVAAEPGLALRDVVLSDQGERHRLRYLGNGPDPGARTASTAPGGTVTDAFEHQAAATPDALALVSGGERVTFGELNARANRIAWALREHGVGPDDVVGLLLPRGPALIVALLGVLKAGGAYLPLDRELPDERLHYMLGNAGTTLAVTNEELAARLPGGVRPVLGGGAPTGNPPRVTTADHLIYVIYTSGSTGRPKGVAMAHRPLRNLIAWQLGRCGVAGPTLQFSAINFDISFQELFTSWLGGESVALVTEEQRRDGGQLLDAMIEAGTRRLFCPPMVLEQIAQAAADRDVLPPLREIQTAGEQLHLGDEVLDLLDRLPDVRVDNQYGPTEAHVITAHRLTGDPYGWPAAPPVGTPIAGTRVHVLDEDLRPVPVGLPGEVYVGGVCLARGYLNRSDLTADRFRPDPFGTEPGARLYRTGDVASWGDDGALRFHGRADDQVKIRGYRIEPGEVEAVLAAHPRVREAAVVPVELVPGDLRLAAYVVAAGEAPPDHVLRAHLEQRLPDYMVPGYLVFLPSLPLTGPGKLDRKALPRPDREAGAVRGYTAPRDRAEAAMAEIWAAVTGLPRVGAHDDFFELGGHSLLATRVIARVNREFGLELPLRAIFSHRTVARLTAAVHGGPAPAPTRAPLRPRAGDGPALPSFAQQRLWFIDRLQPGSVAYVMPDTTYRIQGPLDPVALETALHRVIERQAVLRSRFVEDGGQPRLVFDPPDAIPLRHHDLTGEPDPAAAALDFTLAAAREPFTLTEPLLRATLLRLGEDDHVLQLTVHHSVFDGWSMGVLEADLSAALRGPDPGWAPLVVDYADFAAWQRETLTEEVIAAHAAYWRDRLAGAPPALELCTDKPRPPLPSHRGATVRFTLPATLVTRLRELARRHDATLFMLAVAAYQVLLGRYAASDDVVVGCPAAGRDRPELEPLVGFFVNSLPLRADLAGDPSFTRLLDQVRDTTLDAFAHQELPFERLVEELAPPRDLSRNPVVQAWFDLFTPSCALEVAGAGTERFTPPWATTRFDVELHLAEDADGGLTGDLVYALDLFDHATMTGFAGHYTTLLAAVADDPDRPTSELPLAGPSELDRIRGWNDAAALPEPATETVTERFARVARRTPDAPALIAGGTRLSYSEIAERAARLAGALAARGAGPETLVAVSLRRTADLPVTLLAVATAGAAYVALDPAHPAERRHGLTADSGALLVIADEDDGYPAPVVTVTDLERAPVAPVAATGPGNALYVVYTSGSTGRPKGVVMPHGPTATLMRWAEDRYPQAPVALQYFPVTSDVCSYELWSTWWAGGCAVLADETDRLDPDRVAALIERHGVTTVLLPGAMLDEVAARRPRGLRQVITTGDRLAVTDAIRALGVPVDNQWGSTEVNVVTAQRLEPPPEHWPDAPGIGGPVSGGRIHVLDGRLRPVPVGVPGELYVGGPQPARGYLGLPGRTAAAFLPDPFTGPGARMYRTGDRGRWRPDGTLEFLGRTDFQLKVHGYRVEPGEIEAVLREHPAVRRSVVVAHRTGAGPRLAGYVSPVEGRKVDDAGLREHLRRRLPDQLVPDALVVLPRLPLTSTGKVDRAALPVPASGAAGSAAPRHETDERILAVWREVLGRDDIGVRDSFFDLGGHSLLCVQVLSRVNREFAVELPLSSLFSHRTVAGLADLIATAEPAARPLRPAPADAPLVPSSAQRRLWFLEQLQPGTPAYLVPCTYRLHGPVDAPALARAFGEVQRRHSVLRSHLPDEQTVVVRAEPVPLELVDLSGAPDPAAAARERAAESAAVPFDLATGPLLRGTLFRLDAEDHVLHVVVHHAVFDGVSRQVFTRDLAAAYRSEPRPALPVQYTDYAAWQRENLAVEDRVAYWREALRDVPPAIELPTDHPRPPMPSSRGASVEFAIPAATTAALRELAGAHRATLFMTTLAALQALLGRYARTDDVVVGCPTANRTRAEVEDLVGFFVNVLPLRADLSGAPEFTKLLAQVRDTTLAGFAHQDLPFEQLVEELAPPRDLSRNPVVQAWFQLFETDGLDELRLPGVRVSPFEGEARTTRFDLELHLLTEPDGTITAELVYATDLFEADTARRFAGHYATLLDEVARDAARPVRDIPVAGPAELRQVLTGWNDTAVPLGEATLAERFEAQVRRTPDATAVSGAQRLTYAELNAEADLLATRLRERGARPDDVVAVVRPRGAAFVTALLGVVKAGAAYLPVDPDLPGDRVAHMVDRAGVRLAVDDGGVTPVGGDPRPAAVPPPPSTPDNLAYVLYTSGSTGRPKGVAVAIRSLLNLVDWHLGTYRLGPGDVVSQVASPSFDAAGWEIWPALLSGACLDIPPQETAEVPSALAGHFAEAGTTVTFVPTPLAEALLAEPLGPPLRALLTGGDALRPRPGDDPGVPVVNHYGPTENAVVATATGPLGPPWGVPPIGAPIANVRAYVLDDGLRPVGAGLPGELCLGGAGVARGYTGEPAMTAEWFVPDPFGEPGARLYRTGDLVRWLPSGTLQFLGRLDDQLQVRGYRIEPGEVEAALLACPGITAAAVAVSGDRLTGYLVGNPPEPAQLRTRLAEVLPRPLIPAVFVPLERLPRTRSGKLDRRALPAAPRPAGTGVAPRDPVEAAIAGIWAEVLGLDRVAVHDDFFDLGGHSLLGTRVIVRIEDAFGVRLPMRVVFERRTVAELAAGVADAVRAEIERMPDEQVTTELR
ncbi:non-ribosomal peptide synthetase [Amycolatopsis sp. PS_44_ISF1]|uniref:non-ribosomal peptide synthetase n=1 Tax=Amycolatopsis sp. PS_44_ISF1 TaxID=2974917 RepID=UPI0028DD6077|nr:non-ribosomal peptide synthetase [Amycolatopsis sp. PS_44_ISF1]MDT8914694.1 amino acid adenylation domain-containing protein [Amycolatopsis sp. PS_44_ISF1]